MSWKRDLQVLGAMLVISGCTAIAGIGPACADFDDILGSIHSVNPSGAWADLSSTEFQKRWKVPVVEANDEFVVFEQTPLDVICNCAQVANFYAGQLRSIAIARTEPDYATATRHAAELLAVVRPETANEIAAGPVDARLYRWKLVDEGGVHRQLGLETTVSRCGQGWELRASIAFFRMRPAADNLHE